MTIEEVIKMLNNKKTTINSASNRLKKFVEDFQDSREEFYFEQFGKKLKKIHPSEIDLEEQTEEIYQALYKDTAKFVIKYAVEMTDKLLDAINEKKVDKTAAYNFLAMIQALKKSFEEDDEE